MSSHVLVGVTVAALALLVFYAQPVIGRDCLSLDVPPCPQRADRDILFLVDASESMDPSRFQNEMLDFAQSMYCAFDPSDSNRAGMVSFAAKTSEIIEFKSYTVTEWFAAVEVIRATPNLCCSCCTPTATAFNLAKKILQRVPSPESFRIVFTLTDGAPWANQGTGLYSFPGTSPAEYLMISVPSEAAQLKALSSDSRKSRLMLIGVPNKNGEPPRSDYFAGIPDPEKTPDGKPAIYQCVARNNQKSCAYMRKPPFPIVSSPIEKNLFSTDTWDVQYLISATVPAVCELLPTASPTTEPTVQPTTGKPTRTPSMGPTRKPTSRAPSRSPSRTPSRGPTRKPTSKAPTWSPTRSPTRKPTSQAPTKSPTRSPTAKPTRKPTARPTQSPTHSPIKPELMGLDMYFLLDRSRSMRWVPDLCRSAPGGDPYAKDDVACWKLFISFVGNIVNKVAQLPFRVTQQLGWQRDFDDKRRGIRVSIYAFACKDKQKTPVTIIVGEKIDNPDDFQVALEQASKLVPSGGTCPGEAIERAAAQAQGVDGKPGDQYLDRLMKTAILFTDGVFYDGDRSERAAHGLFYFRVLTYSMAIAVPIDNTEYGLSPAEIQMQKAQLTAFAEDDESRFINFGLEGIQTLNGIADSFVKRLPLDVVHHFYDVSAKPYWCGWTNKERCTNLIASKIPTGKYCKWVSVSKTNTCVERTWCQHSSREKCTKDRYCYWNMRKCYTRDRYLPTSLSG